MIVGKIFNDNYKDNKFIVLLDSNGEIVDEEVIDGILYTNFVHYEDLYKMNIISYKPMKYFRYIVPKDNAEIIISGEKFLIDRSKSHLSEIFSISEADLWKGSSYCYNAVLFDPRNFRFFNINNIEHEKWITIFQEQVTALEYLKNPSAELIMLSICTHPASLAFVKAKNQTFKICKTAVTLEPKTIIFVDHQCYELCKLAVDLNKSCINFIRNEEIRHSLAQTI